MPEYSRKALSESIGNRLNVASEETSEKPESASSLRQQPGTELSEKSAFSIVGVGASAGGPNLRKQLKQ